MRPCARLNAVPPPNTRLNGAVSAAVMAASALTTYQSFSARAGLGNPSNWLFRVEYLHYDFGNQFSSTVSNVSTVGAASTSLGNTSGRLTADMVRGALSYKFEGTKY
jgi:hypothetical protein